MYKRQRVLLAWGMGWAPAQEISGRDWLYPFLIYSMADPYAAVRFDAWKSLQTLPGFSDFDFLYTADEQSLGETVARTYRDWWDKVRAPSATFEAKTALDPNGRFQQDVFPRLRSERDDKPMVLAE